MVGLILLFGNDPIASFKLSFDVRPKLEFPGLILGDIGVMSYSFW